MLLDRTTIQAFLQPTLTCAGSASCQAVVELIQHQTETSHLPPPEPQDPLDVDITRLVLLDPQHQALGLLSSVDVLRLWCNAQSPTPDLSPPELQQQKGFGQQTIAEFATTALEPLIFLSNHLTLEQFWQHLSQVMPSQPPHWAIINGDNGTFWGLLDAPRLLQYLASHGSLRARLSATDAGVETRSRVSTPSPPVRHRSPIDPTTLTPAPNDLLAAVSHDLKTPLTAIIGLSNLLQDERLGASTARQARYLELIHQKGHQLITMVNDLLDLSQIQSQRLSLSTHTIDDLTGLCEAAVAQALHRYRLEGHESNGYTREVQLNIADDLQTLVADELRLQQTLVLLLGSALTLAGEAGDIDLKVEDWDQWVAFTVWYRGLIIPAYQQPLMFQTPLTLEGDAGQSVTQTGLGLILAQQLAHLQRGEITYAAPVQQGNQFTLFVPPSPNFRDPLLPQPVSANKHLPQPLPSLDLTVLHLDTSIAGEPANHEASDLTDISHQLHHYGCRVIAVDDLEQAELLAQIWKPHVILYTSPDPTLLRELRQDSLLAEFPFVISGSDTDGLIRQTLGQSVFLCPPSPEMQAVGPERATATLLKTLQTAAGMD